MPSSSSAADAELSPTLNSNLRDDDGLGDWNVFISALPSGALRLGFSNFGKGASYAVTCLPDGVRASAQFSIVGLSQAGRAALFSEKWDGMGRDDRRVS